DVSPGEALIRRDAPPGSGPAGLGGGIKEPNQISPQVLRTRVRLRSEIKDGQVVIHGDARAIDDSVSNQAGLRRTDPSGIAARQKGLAASVADGGRAMLRLDEEELEADAMGFGALVRREHPKEWRELRRHWHAHSRQVQVNINVAVEARLTGLTGNPASFRP